MFIKIHAKFKSPADDLLDKQKATVANNPAVGHTLLWILEQQNVTKKSPGKTEFFHHPAGILRARARIATEVRDHLALFA